jgi:hypothetical protein
MKHLNHVTICLSAVLGILLGMVAIATQPLAHPLDPLSTEELSSVAQIIRSEGNAGRNDLFTWIALHEPPKNEVLAWKPEAGSRREGFAVVFNQELNKPSRPSWILSGDFCSHEALIGVVCIEQRTELKESFGKIWRWGGTGVSMPETILHCPPVSQYRMQLHVATNVPAHRPRASDDRFETAALSRGSVQPGLVRHADRELFKDIV